MTPLESYFDRIFVVNLKRRPDRMAHFIEEMEKIGVTKYVRFDAYDKPHGNANAGCTASHRALLEIIAYSKWPRVLVFEDDATVRDDAEVTPETLQDRFSETVAHVPSDWDLLYLGGGYGGTPISRPHHNVIRCGRMMTTSSYGITWQMARRMAPDISGVGPIDSLFSGFAHANKFYVLEPRLFVQYENRSDLTEKDDNNEMSMLDSHHVEMMLEGCWQSVTPPLGIFSSHINRREIACSTDLNGQEVIVDGKRFAILRLTLPPHPAPWFRGEPILYHLEAKP